MGKSVATVSCRHHEIFEAASFQYVAVFMGVIKLCILFENAPNPTYQLSQIWNNVFITYY